LTAGSLGDRLGRRRVFTIGFGIFTFASFLCGIAEDPTLLNLARGLQGIGGAGMFATSLALIGQEFHGKDRATAFGVWGATVGGAVAVGPLVGGVLTENFGWEWIFFVNVPVGAAGIVLSYMLLPESRDFSASRGLDLLGAGTVTAGLVLLVLGLTRIEEVGFGSPPTLATLGFAVAFFGAFVFVERRAADPLVPLGLFRLRGLVGAALVAFALTAATAPVSVLVTLYLQNTLGYSASFAGLTGLPFSLCVIAGSVLGGRIAGRKGGRVTMSLGLAVVAASALVTAGITAESGVGYVLAGAALSGLGLGCASVASTARGTSAVEEGNRGLASGFMNTSAQVGTALGLAALISLATARTAALSDGTESGAEALVAGYRFTFLVAAGVASLGMVAALYFFRQIKVPRKR
jgi:MFS family permease